MKKLLKALALLLAMVFVLSMTVVVSADTNPSVSYSVKQTDIYRRTITINISNTKDIGKIYITSYTKGNVPDYVVNGVTPAEYDSTSVTYSYSFEVATNANDPVEKYIIQFLNKSGAILKINGAETFTAYVGANQRFYFDNDAPASSSGSYNGLRSKNYPSCYSGYTYDPNRYTGLREDNPSIVGVYTVKCNKLNVRAGMTTKAKKIGSLTKSTNVVVYKISDGWAKIKYDGQYAYVSAKYLKLA